MSFTCSKCLSTCDESLKLKKGLWCKVCDSEYKRNWFLSKKDDAGFKEARRKNCQQWRDRYKNTSRYKLQNRIRARLHKVLKSKKDRLSIELTGASFEDLLKHVGDEITIDKHIDHQVPLCLFDLSAQDERQAACHFTNLKLLSAKENQQKGKKICYPEKWVETFPEVYKRIRDRILADSPHNLRWSETRDR